MAAPRFQASPTATLDMDAAAALSLHLCRACRRMLYSARCRVCQALRHMANIPCLPMPEQHVV